MRNLTLNLAAGLVALLFLLAGCDGPQKSQTPPPSQPAAQGTPTPGSPAAAAAADKAAAEKVAQDKLAAEKAAAEKAAAEKAAAAARAAAEKAVAPPVPPPVQPATTTPPAANATKGTPAVTQPAATAQNPALLNPAFAREKAPEKFKAKFTTTKGDFVIEVTRAWAPNGADRFYNLVKIGYFNDVAFFRNIAGFMVQFGINGDPAVNAKWRESNIQDDPVQGSNRPGYVTFAQGSALHTRTTQIFINFGDNSRLDGMRFAPFGLVVEGMEVVKSLHNGYGEGAPSGRGPSQGRIQFEGNAYLKQDFPLLDYVKTATIVN